MFRERGTRVKVFAFLCSWIKPGRMAGVFLLEDPVIAFNIAAWLLTLVDLTIVLALILGQGLRRGRPAPANVTILHLFAAFVVLGCLQLFKLGLALIGVINLFGMIRLVYMDLVLAVPASGLLLLIAACAPAGRRRWHIGRTVQVAACLLLAPAAIGVYATFIEPFRTQLERPTAAISSDRIGHSPVRIAVLADIQTNHVTRHEEEAIDRLMAEAPDLILLPGDLWQGTRSQLESNLPALRGLLNRLRAPGGAYFVQGNCEVDAEIRRILEGTPVRMLDNEIVRIHIRDRNVTIGGIELDYTPAAERIVRQLETASDTDDIRLVISHYPDTILQLEPNSRIDLVIAGHTHGGQIVIPGFGPPLTLSHVPRHVAAGGLHDLEGRHIYVSRGLGCERNQAPRIRFLCPPEVTLLTLGNAVSSNASR